jgi:hypothetical protein
MVNHTLTKKYFNVKEKDEVATHIVKTDVQSTLTPYCYTPNKIQNSESRRQEEALLT